MLKSKLRSLNIEDNLNNTFFDKVLPHTTAVAWNSRVKVRLFPEIAKQNWTLLHKNLSSVSTLIFFSCKGRRTFNANYAIAGVVARYARQRSQRKTVWRVAIGLMNGKLKTENGKLPPPPPYERKGENGKVKGFYPPPPPYKGER